MRLFSFRPSGSARFGLVWLLFTLLFWSCGEAQATLHLEVPDTAPQGSAVRVRAVTDSQTPTVTFVWKGKTVKASTRPAEGGLEAEALFPVGVDETGPLTVQARAGKESTKATVAIRKVDWPRQQISVNNKYVSPPKTVMNRIAAERKRSSAVLNRITPERSWSGPFTSPLPSLTVTSGFGGKRMFNGEVRSYHRGADLRGATGTPVRAIADGKVALAEPMYFSGNVIYIDHGQGVVSLYAHLSEIEVKPGDRVSAGQEIGRVGATGRVTGPHLHLGLVLLGQSVNPLSLFPEHHENR